MLFSKYLGSFAYYNIILLLLFSLTVNVIDAFSIINSFSYICLHYLIIYLGLYYYRIALYFIYFLYGLGLDLFLINEIGPHLAVYMVLIIFLYQSKKIFQNLTPKKIYILILLIQLIVIFLEMIIANILFHYIFDYYIYLKMFIFSFIILYPTLFLFSKIDNFN